jgi:hypothetical protein
MIHGILRIPGILLILRAAARQPGAQYTRYPAGFRVSFRIRAPPPANPARSLPGILRIPGILLIPRAAAGQPGAQDTRYPADSG